MRKTICGIMRVVLCDNEFAPPADMAIFQVAFLAEYNAVMKRCITAKLCRFLKMGEARIYRERFTATCAFFFLPDKSFVLDVLFKFLRTHMY
jgi:hypothetical protein